MVPTIRGIKTIKSTKSFNPITKRASIMGKKTRKAISPTIKPER